ncbi:uncharacterized protein [Arachis hypogaea]|uniref:uncharacterized protein n=1 Tax=Arachis hypogaea TaxID=3818 RepID=UPI003B216F85
MTTAEFKLWIQDMEFLDVALANRMFTWFRGQSCSRIDRVLVSLEWLEEFPETRLRGGPRGLSYHYPLIVDITRLGGGPRPFRSLDAWFTHEGFLRMVKGEWRNLGDVQFIDKLKALTIPLGKWHKENFRDMDMKIMKFEEEIKKVDDMVSNGVVDGTVEARRRVLETSPIIGFRDGLVIRITEEEATELEWMPSNEKIKDAVWDCESTKAPGSDGYNMNFIKKCWEDVSGEFTAAVMGFFQSAILPTDANVTWVALAPKFVRAKEIKDFKPISMVGCIYKVISKILVQKMHKIMPGLVGETHSAFVQGRKIHDGILIACETVQWLKLRKKSSTIIKLDFQKAYDRVKWSFVDIVLQKMGFGRRWREWIKECVCSAFMMIREAVRNGCITPVLVGRDNIELSHLQFADDTILFCPSEEETIRNYKRLLRCFEMMSGLSINFDKSNLIPVNCEQSWAQQMCRLLGCKEAYLPVRYLGISLGANPRLVKTQKPVIDKVLQAEVLPVEITSYSFTSTIWRGFVPPRVELFTWFALVGKVNTRERLCGVLSCSLLEGYGLFQEKIGLPGEVRGTTGSWWLLTTKQLFKWYILRLANYSICAEKRDSGIHCGNSNVCRRLRYSCGKPFMMASQFVVDFMKSYQQSQKSVLDVTILGKNVNHCLIDCPKSQEVWQQSDLGAYLAQNSSEEFWVR